jgi:xanthosine utilization system XapX-like protein
MTDGSLIQMRSAGFRVASKGPGRGQGLVLLYQDKLARVSYQAEVVGVALGAALAGIAYPLLRVSDYAGAIGVAIAGLAGGWIGERADRWTAPRRVAGGGGRVTVIPLDSITSVQTGPGGLLGGLLGGKGLVVTAADHTEYRFYGRLDTWLADLAAALTVRGRAVRVTPGGITVTPLAPGS